jgi:NitT/TauT family transport system ATP-binding protein/sulfonate transport system ATP-binding protein
MLECHHLKKSYQTPSGVKEVIGDISLLSARTSCGALRRRTMRKDHDDQPAFGPRGAHRRHGERRRQAVDGPGPERGVIYQTISLFPWYTTMGNVEYGPRMRGVPKKERRALAQHYINLVGLQGFENSFPVKLSGGMKQRVGIARAYCNNPLVLFMDEPFGALDAQTRYLMQEELEKICSKERKTVVFVTNNIEEALYLADRIVVMRNCPSTIKAVYVIDLARPRNYVDPEFLRLRKEITQIVDKTL